MTLIQHHPFLLNIITDNNNNIIILLSLPLLALLLGLLVEHVGGRGEDLVAPALRDVALVLIFELLRVRHDCQHPLVRILPCFMPHPDFDGECQQVDRS